MADRGDFADGLGVGCLMGSSLALLLIAFALSLTGGARAPGA